MNWSLLSLRVGQVQSGPRGKPTAIDKQPVAEPQYLGLTGFQLDQQGDTVHHGGPEKAVHHYAADHFDWWRAELAAQPARNLQPGAFGENLSTLGLTEDEAALGDVFQLGRAVLQISQPRQPCWKLNVRMNVPDMALRVQMSGRTGWYYRVLEPGWVAPGDALARVQRPHAHWTLACTLRVLYRDGLNMEALAQLAELPVLAPRMRALAQRRLASCAIEDWDSRLQGAQP